jgi:hypothetical protein
VDQVKVGAQALGDQPVEDERDTRRHHGEGTAATRLQVVLVVSASKPQVIGLPALGLWGGS